MNHHENMLNRVGHVGLVGHSRGSLSWVKLVGQTRRSFSWVKLVGQTGGSFSLVKLVGHSWSFITVGHSCASSSWIL